ncbi:universal stress protein UspA [Cupriavidus sp. USMAA2-4]|uniref:Universal stress protein UspA n=1 Tax=Cupriavidus malaysiensis TaxID=367825 RepID=A0ABM6FF55_9BURK|nr:MULTISPECIES: universal stress protein [Cupriavidus]AOY95036.1 universal stress protein UspA [Cupriavidus sp. USMAA2-4]AOZ02070.1 universal stress protein UspA [Cupriavidus sp. USMAHM13]AOZ10541.1 universal stress protein UspA [Cupriavidus malaysiensis]
MRPASILVHLDSSARSSLRLALAARLAQAAQARLIGLYAAFEPDPAWYAMMEGAETYMAEDMARRDATRARAEAAFHAAVDALPIASEWRQADGDAVTSALREAREAELVVAGQTDPSEPEGYVGPQFLESLILESGRPVLVVPCAGRFDTIGTRAIVAWNGSREAARALHDAIPLLSGAQALLLCAGDLRASATPPAHACRALALHGVQAALERSPPLADAGVGELLLSRAADFGADLIVMGAYGRGRMRELVLGGVTQALLSSMTVPVLMAH